MPAAQLLGRCPHYHRPQCFAPISHDPGPSKILRPRSIASLDSADVGVSTVQLAGTETSLAC